MSKIVITIQDTADENVDVISEFIPRWHNPANGGVETPAQELALLLIDFIQLTQQVNQSVAIEGNAEGDAA